jgi:hypothetical protein
MQEQTLALRHGKLHESVFLWIETICYKRPFFCENDIDKENKSRYSYERHLRWALA